MHLRIIYYYKFSEHNDNIFCKKMQVVYKYVKVFTKVIANYMFYFWTLSSRIFFSTYCQREDPGDTSIYGVDRYVPPNKVAIVNAS